MVNESDCMVFKLLLNISPSLRGAINWELSKQPYRCIAQKRLEKASVEEEQAVGPCVNSMRLLHCSSIAA